MSRICIYFHLLTYAWSFTHCLLLHSWTLCLNRNFLAFFWLYVHKPRFYAQNCYMEWLAYKIYFVDTDTHRDVDRQRQPSMHTATFCCGLHTSTMVTTAYSLRTNLSFALFAEHHHHSSFAWATAVRVILVSILVLQWQPVSWNSKQCVVSWTWKGLPAWDMHSAKRRVTAASTRCQMEGDSHQ